MSGFERAEKQTDSLIDGLLPLPLKSNLIAN
jgi:hypothetical protein